MASNHLAKVVMMSMFEIDEICSDCVSLYGFCKLVDSLVKDILHLESETVRTRHELSQYLEYPYSEYLRNDILSNLAGRYSDNQAYRTYIKILYNNHNPMESKEWVDHIWKLAHGQESDKY